MMHHLVSKASRKALHSVGALYRNASCSSMVIKHYSSVVPTLRRNFETLPKIPVPRNFLKWGSLEFCRSFSFATGFTPLKAKPLETIIDVERAKKKSPEELADIWDDVCFCKSYLMSFRSFLKLAFSVHLYFIQSMAN